MQLTSASEYAIRALIYLASSPDRDIFHISEVSRACNIPEKFLRKIIPLLLHQGLIHSKRGIGGGIKLGKSASEITILDIIQIVEGEMALNKCLIAKEFCSNTRWCAVHVLWSEAQQNVKAILSSKSIEQLARENKDRKKNLSI